MEMVQRSHTPSSASVVNISASPAQSKNTTPRTSTSTSTSNSTSSPTATNTTSTTNGTNGTTSQVAGSANTTPPSSRVGLQLTIFILLSVQQAALLLLLRYVRAVRKERFNVAVSVMSMEAIKLVVSLVVMKRHLLGNWAGKEPINRLRDLLPTVHLMFVPAFLYLVQNGLQWVALEHLPSALYSVLSQLKLLSAAVLSVIVLQSRLSARKWRALVLMVLGISIILINKHDMDAARQPAPENSATSNSHESPSLGSLVTGVSAALALAVISGFAGVYFEKVLKKSGSGQVSLWARNVQLAGVSVVVACGQLWWSHREEIVEQGMFHDFSWVTIVCQLVGALGGLLVGLMVQYADSIIKGMATALAIILTSLGSSFLFGEPISVIFWMSTGVVVISLFNYAEPDPPVSKPKPE